MNLERFGRDNKVRVAVGVLVVLAVVGGAYLAFAEREPIEISSAEELQQIRNGLGGNYVLVDDIDMSHVDNFEPIGGANNPFTGTFDGNEHTISNLTIDRPNDANVGLFFNIGSEGLVENVTLRNVKVRGDGAVGTIAGGLSGGTVARLRVTGEVSGGEVYVGGLVGLSQGGEFRDSHAEVDVTGQTNVGGLLGFSSTDTITNSYATGNVSGEENVGGIAGNAGSKIRNSYATGNVNGDKNVGGIAGSSAGDIVNSYAMGNVSGDKNVGGIAGLVGGEIRDSYAIGMVTGNRSVGGLVGRNEGTVSDSYWDVSTTRQKNSDGGTGLTTSEMTGSAARENMDGFNFGEKWRTTEGDYPRLHWEVNER